MKALSKNKEDRYNKIEHLIEDVQLYLEGKEVSALPDNPWKKVQRFAKNNATTLKWGTLVLATVFGMLWFFKREIHLNKLEATLISANSILEKEISEDLTANYSQATLQCCKILTTGAYTEKASTLIQNFYQKGVGTLSHEPEKLLREIREDLKSLAESESVLPKVGFPYMYFPKMAEKYLKLAESYERLLEFNHKMRLACERAPEEFHSVISFKQLEQETVKNLKDVYAQLMTLLMNKKDSLHVWIDVKTQEEKEKEKLKIQNKEKNKEQERYSWSNNSGEKFNFYNHAKTEYSNILEFHRKLENQFRVALLQVHSQRGNKETQEKLLSQFNFHKSEKLFRKKVIWALKGLWRISLLKEDPVVRLGIETEMRRYNGNSEANSPFPTLDKEIDALHTLQIISTPTQADIYLFKYIPWKGFSYPMPYHKNSPLTKGEDKNAQIKWFKRWKNLWEEKKANSKIPFRNSPFPLPIIPAKKIGQTPFTETELPPGSYLIVLMHAEMAPLRVPLHVRHPYVKNPKLEKITDEVLQLKVNYELISKETGQKTEGFTYIPKGPKGFYYGGNSAGAAKMSWKKIPHGFFIQTKETTLGEYADFLEELAKKSKRGKERAQERFPRNFGNNWTLLAFMGKQEKLDEKDKNYYKIVPTLRLNNMLENQPPKNKNWRELPVRGVSYNDAKAFLRWKNFKDKLGREYRLPTEEEWELAARGADGRQYTWGNHFEIGVARLTQGYGGVELKINEEKLKEKFRDYSVFGVQDLAGNLAEWVEGHFFPLSDAQIKELEEEKKSAKKDEKRLKME